MGADVSNLYPDGAYGARLFHVAFIDESIGAVFDKIHAFDPVPPILASTPTATLRFHPWYEQD